jgi:hypothetical protein
MFFVALFLPFWGVLIVLILHFQIFFEADNAIDIDVEKLKLESELYKGITIDSGNMSSRVVPIEEALVVNSARERRTIIMDVLNDNPKDYIEFLQKAGNNDDTEVVHYAVTAMVEISKENDYTLQILEAEYSDNPYDLGVLSRYCEFLWGCLTQNLMQGQVETINRTLYSKLVREKLDIFENIEVYSRLAQNELKLKNFDQVKKILSKMKKKWPHSEEYILLNIRYLELMNKGKEIKKFINEINKSQIFLSSQTKEVLAFWAD